MKLHFFLFVSCILINSCQLFSQNDLHEISLIDKKVNAQKTNLPNFKKIEKYKDSVSYKNIFVNNKIVEKIEVCSIENNIEKKVEWFYDNAILIYCEKNWKDLSKNKIIDVEKFYTNKDNLIAWFNKSGQLVDRNSFIYQEVCDRIINFGKNAVILAKE